MKARGKSYMDISDRERFPRSHLVHPVKPKPFDQRADAFRNDNRLGSGDLAQGSPVQMIKVRMSH